MSGAYLLLIYLSDRPTGVPFLLKVATLAKARTECNATLRLGRVVQESYLAADGCFSVQHASGKWGGLLYVHRAADSQEGAANPRALRELIFDSKTNASTIRSILNEVFRKLHGAHSSCRQREVPLDAHFRRYFRKHLARSRIRRVLEPNADSEWVTFQGSRIYNPLLYLARLPRRLKVFTAPVHGDLHPDNIIIDRKKEPHLIDFAWARLSQDVLLDFVLLENSIRFMAFPRPINLKDQLKVDRALLEERGSRRILSLRLCSRKHRKDYVRLASAVRVIREKAHAALGDDFSMKRYLLTQFLVLYGLLRYEDYDPYVTTRALGLIAARLKKIGLPS